MYNLIWFGACARNSRISFIQHIIPELSSTHRDKLHFKLNRTKINDTWTKRSISILVCFESYTYLHLARSLAHSAQNPMAHTLQTNDSASISFIYTHREPFNRFNLSRFTAFAMAQLHSNEYDSPFSLSLSHSSSIHFHIQLIYSRSYQFQSRGAVWLLLYARFYYILFVSDELA